MCICCFRLMKLLLYYRPIKPRKPLQPNLLLNPCVQLHTPKQLEWLHLAIIILLGVFQLWQNEFTNREDLGNFKHSKKSAKSDKKIAKE